MSVEQCWNVDVSWFACMPQKMRRTYISLLINKFGEMDCISVFRRVVSIKKVFHHTTGIPYKIRIKLDREYGYRYICMYVHKTDKKMFRLTVWSVYNMLYSACSWCEWQEDSETRLLFGIINNTPHTKTSLFYFMKCGFFSHFFCFYNIPITITLQMCLSVVYTLTLQVQSTNIILYYINTYLHIVDATQRKGGICFYFGWSGEKITGFLCCMFRWNIAFVTAQVIIIVLKSIVIGGSGIREFCCLNKMHYRTKEWMTLQTMGSGSSINYNIYFQIVWCSSIGQESFVLFGKFHKLWFQNHDRGRIQVGILVVYLH